MPSCNFQKLSTVVKRFSTHTRCVERLGCTCLMAQYGLYKTPFLRLPGKSKQLIKEKFHLYGTTSANFGIYYVVTGDTAKAYINNIDA